MLFKLLDRWRKSKFLDPSIARKDVTGSECILSRAYGLLKAHKIPIDDNNNLNFSDDLPFRLVISCIDSFKYFFFHNYMKKFYLAV